MRQSGSLRLPTRCPVCKGALIERMPGSMHGSFIWFRCQFCTHAWKFFVDDSWGTPNGELTGHVFIITRGRRKYKLGSVAVHAIPQDALKKHLKSKTLQSELESETLERDIRSLTAMIGTAQSEEERLWKILQGDQDNLKKGEAWSAAYKRAKGITRQIEELQARQQQLASGEYFFDGLPSPVSTAKTDADGKFTLTIPRQGWHGVVACASRELFKGRESYFWFVWVTLDGHHSKRLTLSNSNAVGAGSSDSALQ
jgi:hypothetical protein